jgi:hypothetical protein
LRADISLSDLLRHMAVREVMRRGQQAMPQVPASATHFGRAGRVHVHQGQGCLFRTGQRRQAGHGVHSLVVVTGFEGEVGRFDGDVTNSALRPRQNWLCIPDQDRDGRSD